MSSHRANDFAVLGFLLAKPMHGYALKKVLSPGLPRDEQLNDGILYPLLARLERDKLLKKRAEAVGGRTRNVYRVTAAGRRAFEAWLHGGDDEGVRVTYDFLAGDPFLIKSLFFSQLDDDEVCAKLASRRDATKEKLETLKRIRLGMVERGVDPFRTAILDLGIEQSKVVHGWLARMALRASKVRRSEPRGSR